MPMEMPKGFPFSVDTWPPCSKRKRHHFLTHAHKDHTQGISSHASFPIYSTQFTKTLLLRYYPQVDESVFVAVEVGQSLIVEDPDGDFTVTAFDANHCPGAVMFLFEGNFGNILHTGDCRLTPECLQNLPEKYVGKKGKEPSCPLDYIFLDCTFGQFPAKMPSKHAAIQQVINCIWKHPDAPIVYLTCDLLGQEEILVQVSQTFGGKIYVDKSRNSECFKALEITVPEILSQDPSSRFQLFDGFPRLYERAETKIAEARANLLLEPLIIRPSAKWYEFDDGFSVTEKRRKERFDQAVRDFYGVWHVCYTIHSPKDELEWALQLLAPKWVVSTTPSCRAMELDYVKRQCFNNQRIFDDSLCKLLDINVASLDPDVHESLSCSRSVDRISYSFKETQSEPVSFKETQPEPVVIATFPRKRLSMSPPSKRPKVTLFGRARVGIQDFTFEHEQRETVSTSCDSMERATTQTEDTPFQMEEAIKMKFKEPLELQRVAEFAENKCTSAAMKIEISEPLESESMATFAESNSTSAATEMGTHKHAVCSPITLPKSYSETLRRFYRSVNVPIPQPLPSLVQLMDANKYAAKRM